MNLQVIKHLYNKVFATTLLDRLTHRCNIAYATQLGNQHQVTGTTLSTVIGSSWRVAVRRPAGGNWDNLTGVNPYLPVASVRIGQPKTICERCTSGGPTQWVARPPGLGKSAEAPS